MVLRREQIHALGEDGFINRVYGTLVDHFPKYAELSWDAHGNRTRDLMEKAREYGLETEKQMAVFVVSAWIMGEGFDTKNQEIHRLLTSPSESAEAKVDGLVSVASHHREDVS